MNKIDSADMGPWLSPEDLTFVRHKVPMAYVNIVPVKTKENGDIEGIGLLLHASESGLLWSFPGGRILFHEKIHDAIARHIDNDLGSMALPTIPPSIRPFTVGEYFPTPGVGWFDERQHAISLGYIVPIQGDPTPGESSLDFSWYTPGELRTASLQAEMEEAHVSLLKRALAHLSII
ncbi:MAG: DUF4916 domain-containing protein [Actinomycetaceae bacterium]|nr:DUF4916 domain-containing protein [Actinomycetaceae bacterium]